MSLRDNLTEPPPQDPIDFGSKRETRRTRPLPPWLEENAGLIAVAIVMVIMTISFAWSGAGTVEAPAAAAQVKIATGPVKLWADGSADKLKSVKVTLKNVGPVKATGVTVTVLLKERPYGLVGPVTIEPGQVATYFGMQEVTASSSDPISARMSCSNCG